MLWRQHIQAIIAKDWSDHFSKMYRDEEFIFFPGLTPNYLFFYMSGLMFLEENIADYL